MSALSNDMLDRLAAFALKLVAGPDDLLREKFADPPRPEDKPDKMDAFDPVTAADRTAEALMRDMIAEAWPDHAVRGEEMADAPAAGDFTWLIDPIDGTRAFLCGLPTWTVLAAVLHEGRPVIGVCRQPLLGTSWLGTPAGAWRIGPDGARTMLRTTNTGRLQDAFIGTTLPQLYDTPARRRVLAALQGGARQMLYDGDAYFYCLLAEGRMDAVCDTQLAAHDIAALIPIINGAGGVVRDWRGRPDPLGGDVLAAANPALMDQLLAAIES